jgi:hypothetical protein
LLDELSKADDPAIRLRALRLSDQGTAAKMWSIFRKIPQQICLLNARYWPFAPFSLDRFASELAPLWSG